VLKVPKKSKASKGEGAILAIEASPDPQLFAGETFLLCERRREGEDVRGVGRRKMRVEINVIKRDHLQRARARSLYGETTSPKVETREKKLLF